ncbi:pilus assembly protein [Kineosporia sp. J2-2]|uniref:Pilus assembly protein n=1 Tax=Kineosporia corallincola TaxID=2835133 RepID=A0ABS5TTH2_9ACTN|nr:pilus assembly protein [Kineosporia corallincola]MBT0774107.1 pilus assembly protein [Kineosporia corallincola]
MKRRGRHETLERGSAVIEFVALGMLLLLPVAYLVLVLGRVQAASFAAGGAVREATRAFVTADDDEAARERAARVTELALQDHGFRTDEGKLDISCNRSPCLTSGGQVMVEVQIEARFPWLPTGFAEAVRAHVVVRADQVETVDRFRDFGS